MIDTSPKWLSDFLDEQTAACQAQQEKLLCVNREDEACFEKIKANVYGIFKSILAVAIKSSAGNEKAVRAFFLDKLKQIPSAWSASYEKAAAHEDAKIMHIETVKLEAVRQIKAACLTGWKEQA